MSKEEITKDHIDYVVEVISSVLSEGATVTRSDEHGVIIDVDKRTTLYNDEEI